MAKKPNDYQYIRAWGRMLHSSHQYIWEEVQKAKQDKAPEDAIYFGDGRWHTFAEVTSQQTRDLLGQILTADSKRL